MSDPDDLVGLYREAVELNLNNVKLRPMRNQVHVQVAPGVFKYGKILLPGKPKELGNQRLWCRYGTVLTRGEGVDAVDIGDVVFFSNMLGVRFRGYDNPLKLPDSVSNDVEFRIFTVTSAYSEVWGKWKPSFIGQSVRYLSPGAPEVKIAKVLDESYLFNGYLKAEVDGNPLWLPYSWLIADAEE